MTAATTELVPRPRSWSHDTNDNRQTHRGRPHRGRQGARHRRAWPAGPVRATAPTSTASTSTSRRGEVFALLGTKGAGKTTPLEVLAGFGTRSGGTVSVLGVDPATDRAALQRRMGVQLQDGGFVDDLTVLETLTLWQQLSERPDRPERLLERFELAGRRGVAVGKLFGGEKRRLDLAMAVWGSPDW